MTTQNNGSTQTFTNHLVIKKITTINFFNNILCTYIRKVSNKMKNIICIFVLLGGFLLCNLPTKAQIGPMPINPVLFAVNKCHIDDWEALKALYSSTGGDKWKKQDGWEAIANHSSPPTGCDLSGLQGITLNLFGRVEKLQLTTGRIIPLFLNIDLELITDGEFVPVESDCEHQRGYGNNLRGTLPDELGLLKRLKVLDLGHNFINGTIPSSLSNLNHLEVLYLNNNDLTGAIPDLPAISCLKIQGNLFNCEEIDKFLNTNNSSLSKINYSPQYFEHNNDNFIANPSFLAINNFTIDFQPAVPLPGAGMSADSWYSFKKNASPFLQPAPIGGGTLPPVLNLLNLQPNQAGKYTFHIKNACLPDLEIISKPVYVIYPGYDLEGQPVQYNEIMVEFDNEESTAIYESEILNENGGFIADRCNCNRELYLWKFPSDSATVQALLEIDASTRTESIDDDDGDIDGGLNSVLFTIGSPLQAQPVSWQIEDYPVPIGSYPDEVKIFILDTGLEQAACIDDTYLYNDAPVDDCYNNNPAGAGYNYLNNNIISTNYQDGQGHGTFGYNIMTDGFDTANNIKIVPLKIFNNAGKGNLFNFVCALYHAIDHNADIVNISAGFRGQASSILEKAINKAREQEIFICTAAGNDTVNNDTLPQYPSSYAGMYHYEFDNSGVVTDSIRYSNVISIAALKPDNFLTNSSNFGKKSVTMACYGQNLAGKDLNCNNVTANGTSFSTFVVSRFLALEIAKNNTRSMVEIWDAFDSNKLKWGRWYLRNRTITGKMLDINLWQGQNKISSTLNEVINKNINEFDNNLLKDTNSEFSVKIINTSTSKAHLIYEIIREWDIKVSLYDANGRFIQNLADKTVNSGTHQLTISKNILNSGTYFIHILHQSNDTEPQLKILKMLVLK